MAFCAAKEMLIPNEVLTAVAFDALDTVARSFASYGTLVMAIRRVLLTSVYTDVPPSLIETLPVLHAAEDVGMEENDPSGFHYYYDLHTAYGINRKWSRELQRLKNADKMYAQAIVDNNKRRDEEEYMLAMYADVCVVFCVRCLMLHRMCAQQVKILLSMEEPGFQEQA